LAIYVAVALAFGLGILVDRTGWLPGSPTYPPGDLGKEFDVFWQAWRVVDEHYVDRAAVQPVRMTQGAIRGMLASLGDIGHTTYLTRDELQKEMKKLEGKLEGIGATVTMRNRRPTIVATMPASPARKDGLKPGDVLVEVDGKPVADLPLSQVVQRVRGKPGTVVELRLAREGKTGLLRFRITRAKVSVPAVAWQMLPGVPVADIAIREFGIHADEQLREALGQARQAGARGLIIDVRGNPGGLKEQAVAVTSEFLKGGNVFLEQDAQGRRTEVPVKPGGKATDLPLCVLIDEGTASSAEILAGAIQDHVRGKIVGAKTFGTGTVLRPFVLSDGSAVFLAVTKWLTPNGREIWHKGITPDYPVALPPDGQVFLPEAGVDLDAAALARSKDTQLLKALEVIKKQLGLSTTSDKKD
jgi:carboxyl-terminal processing protease